MEAERSKTDTDEVRRRKKQVVSEKLIFVSDLHKYKFTSAPPHPLGSIYVSDFRREGAPSQRVTICLRGGGRIPPMFGISSSQTGDKMYLNANVDNVVEQKALQLFDDHLKQMLLRKEHWPDHIKKIPVSVEDIDDKERYFPVLKPAQPKKDKEKKIIPNEFYSPTIKIQIPVAGNGETSATVKDEENNVISYQNLNGLVWKQIVFEMTVWYFSGNNCGVAKKLKFVKVQRESEELSGDIYDVLDEVEVENAVPDVVPETCAKQKVHNEVQVAVENEKEKTVRKRIKV